MLKVQEERLKAANAQGDHTDLASEIERLRKEKEEFLLEIAEKKNVQNRIKELDEFLKNKTIRNRKLWWGFCKKTYRKEDGYDESLKVIFKSGLEVEIEK